MAGLSDDLGTQSSLILSPDIINEFLVPEYERLFSFYKERNILINFHSCGHIEPLLELFMDLGVDVLNPLQATANNLLNVRKVTQGRMALQGGISTAVIMQGPVDRIKDEVRYVINLLGKEGGYFCCPDQGMPFPQENINAVYQALDEYGRYPLNG
jgi:uroporphyrinogen decarboxylase